MYHDSTAVSLAVISLTTVKMATTIRATQESNDEYKHRIAAELRSLISNDRRSVGTKVSKVEDHDSSSYVKMTNRKKNKKVKTPEEKKKPARRRSSAMDIRIQKSLLRSMDDVNKSFEYFHMSKQLVPNPQSNVEMERETYSSPTRCKNDATSLERLSQPSVSAVAFNDHFASSIQDRDDMFGHIFGDVVEDLNEGTDRQKPPPLLRLSKLKFNENNGDFDLRSEAFVFAPRPGKGYVNATLGTCPLENSVVVSKLVCTFFPHFCFNMNNCTKKTTQNNKGAKSRGGSSTCNYFH